MVKVNSIQSAIVVNSAALMVNIMNNPEQADI